MTRFNPLKVQDGSVYLLHRFGVSQESWFTNDTRVIPLVIACTMFLAHLIGVSLSKYWLKAPTAARTSLNAHESQHQSTMKQKLIQRAHAYAIQCGGYTTVAFMLARLSSSVALLVLSAMTYGLFNQLILYPESSDAEIYVLATYAYTTVLAMVALISPHWRPAATRNGTIVLISSFGVYAYRDLWPLATYTQNPEDLSEGSIIWVKIFILFLTSIIIPLLVPRQYVPVDPENPMQCANPEQTASLFSLVAYTFLDSIILKGSRVRRLGVDELPPLSDRDDASYLAKKGFRYLDRFNGAKSRNMFVGLLFVYREECMAMSALIVIRAIVIFASPIGINRILHYLETDEDESGIRPWFWILWLFFGPMAHTITVQWYTFISSRTRVRTEGLLTQLIFEHSLRIRLKAETPKDTNDIDVSTTKPDTQVGPASKGRTVPSSRNSVNFTGNLNNLVTTDLQNIVSATDFLVFFLYIPLMIFLCIVFLYQVLGWSAFVGFLTMVVFLPLPGYVATKISTVQKAKMKTTDARVQAVSEAVSVLRMIKLFGWEARMANRVQVKREEELRLLWKLKTLGATNGLLSYFIPTFTMIVTYGTYTAIMHETLTASKIFSSIGVFSILRGQLSRILWESSTIIQAKVSLDRVGDFLKNTELLDSFETPSKDPPFDAVHSSEIGFNNTTFVWSKEEREHSQLTSRSFELRIDGELLFKKGGVNLIIGPTGSGKTSMLMALLGEMHFIETEPDSWYNLPRTGGIAYATQESWVQNDTIRNNIIFGSVYDEERYRKVINYCALEQDLELFDAGDSTEVGERGLTLSGGQKARLTLARAIYSPANILLLDDIFAALDVHTSSWIVEKCIQGDLVKGRTILLVTHNVALASPIADFIVSIGLDGRVKSQGTNISLAISRDSTLAAEIREDEELSTKKEQGPVVANPQDGKLVLAEEIVQGHVTMRSFKLLANGLGGAHPFLFFLLFVGGFTLTEWTMTFQTWFLGYWGSKYEGRDESQVDVPFYISAYAAILLLAITLYSASYLFFTFGTIRAARKINAALVESVFGSTLRWLDETPTGRIISRCTQDIRTVDGPLPQYLLIVMDLLLSMLTRLGAIVLFTPLFAFPGLGVALLGIGLGNIYLKAQLSVKREVSNARSPVLSHFGAAMHGLISLRAYNAQEAFKKESIMRINHYTRVARTSFNLNRWMATRMETLGALFSCGLAFYLVYGPRVGSSNTGFSLNMALEFATSILWLMRGFNEFEVQSNSLERIQGYIDIDHEPKSTESGRPPAAWPTSGDLRVENLSARYSPSGPKVLHDISFSVKSGERIGIVGRTGSGKSSLTLALLRCILTEGEVYFDGVPTSTLNLESLRSNITIIPQTPELLSGTLRENLDPFGETDDAVLNEALRSAGLFSLQEEAGDGSINLDTKIAGGGGNLSIGQRQILALARAMIRGSKVLILDEATSAIGKDYKTDAVIQRTLKSQIANDVTVITIAHRLQTVMDADKILVLNSGRIAEFDCPKDLLKKEKSMLRTLVDGSGDRDILYGLAGVE